MKLINYHITVYGRVQGVGYRFFAKKMAERLGIGGFVKNNLDGTVSIEAEGNEISLKEFLNICRSGPDWGHVERIQHEEFPTSGYDGFRIK